MNDLQKRERERVEKLTLRYQWVESQLTLGKAAGRSLEAGAQSVRLHPDSRAL